MNNKSNNITEYLFKVSPEDRCLRLKQKSKLIWFTGLSGSGKSTLSNNIEKKLFEMGFLTYALDGDNLRNGLCSDLSFNNFDRSENIRRIAEISKLMLDVGLITCASFVSPFRKDRNCVRNIVGHSNYIEIFVSTPLSECEKRDVKGLYEKARTGKLNHFTGISSPYEVPVSPDLKIDTTGKTIENCSKEILEFIIPKLK